MKKFLLLLYQNPLNIFGCEIKSIDVEITPVDITEENFRSADAIKAMIDRLRDE